jgi:hypothetical protein
MCDTTCHIKHVTHFGRNANNGDGTGTFHWNLNNDSSNRNRNNGARRCVQLIGLIGVFPALLSKYIASHTKPSNKATSLMNRLG